MAGAIVALLVIAEAARATFPPEVRLGGRPAGPKDPVPAGVHRDETITID
jgi:hypothetical protein